jgi:hypothetical protein
MGKGISNLSVDWNSQKSDEFLKWIIPFSLHLAKKTNRKGLENGMMVSRELQRGIL